MNEIIFWTGIWNEGFTRPVGVYQLAHWLRKHSVESQVIDFCQWYSPEEIIELTVPFISSKTKFLGISSSFWEDSIPNNIKEAVKVFKKEYPHIKIIIGGQRADNEFNKSIADITLLGEAENSLLTLIKGHNLFLPFDITTLDHRFVEKDCILDNEVLPLELGRGCIFKCKFCGHHNLGKSKYTYQRCFHLIEEEIVYNYEKFKTTHYNFLDDTINEDVEKIKNLSMIPRSTGVNIQWNGYLRADLIYRYPDTAYQLLDSGMAGCFFGIETFHPEASLAIGKGWNGKKAKLFLPDLYNNIWQQKINIWCNFIIGLPYETLDFVSETLKWCLDNPIGHHNFVPLGLYAHRTDTGSTSEFQRNYKNYGYEIIDGQWKNRFFDQKKSVNLSLAFNNLLSTSNKTSSWYLLELVNCGVPLEEGKNLLSKDRHNFKSLFVSNFLARYKDKLKQWQ